MRACVKKKPESQNCTGGPLSTQPWKNTILSCTSFMYGPSGLRLGNDLLSHRSGTLPSKSAAPTASRVALSSARPLTALPRLTSDERICAAAVTIKLLYEAAYAWHARRVSISQTCGCFGIHNMQALPARTDTSCRFTCKRFSKSGEVPMHGSDDTFDWS